MRRVYVSCVVCSVLAVPVWSAENGGHVYKKAAAVNHLMEYMVKPAMDRLKVYREAGGPASKEEWQNAFGAVSMVNEASQLVLMDGRVKDDAWSEGALQVISASRDAMLGAYRMDAEGFNKGLKGMSAGCKTCHDVHKKKKE